jgi:hypothetical protein
VYIGLDNTSIKAPLLRDITRFILSILRVMGFVKEDDFGYANADSADVESQLTPLMDMLKDFRLEIKAAISGKEIDKKGLF